MLRFSSVNGYGDLGQPGGRTVEGFISAITSAFPKIDCLNRSRSPEWYTGAIEGKWNLACSIIPFCKSMELITESVAVGFELQTGPTHRPAGLAEFNSFGYR
ncbi:hypothetical protein [uncultured Roseobacter sp.]|uniref:hypothetical protein n=1 Tax=uncultured Roseobacter sp. TaxID=114847 RepID=UPI002603F151|nr:hypothetical protein [uncultured Roseobacter sp.]